jgi:hypothetical protein
MPAARILTAHTNQANADAQRKRELGHIHQGKAALGWSDDDYRYHLHDLTGKTSAADLDAAGRAKVLVFVGRHTSLGVSDVQFLPTAEATKVIEGLKAMLARAERAKGAAHE